MSMHQRAVLIGKIEMGNDARDAGIDVFHMTRVDFAATDRVFDIGRFEFNLGATVCYESSSQINIKHVAAPQALE